MAISRSAYQKIRGELQALLTTLSVDLSNATGDVPLTTLLTNTQTTTTLLLTRVGKVLDQDELLDLTSQIAILQARKTAIEQA